MVGYWMTYTTALLRNADILVLKIFGIWLYNHQEPQFIERLLWSKKAKCQKRVVS